MNERIPDEGLDKKLLEVAKKLKAISYKMDGKIEYFDGEVADLYEIILAYNDKEAIDGAQLHLESLAERGYLTEASKVTYDLFDPEGRLIERRLL